MTPSQLKSATNKELLETYKSKARCFHSEETGDRIYRELVIRFGAVKLDALRLATWHMQHGEGDAEFNDECDKLIAQL